MCHFGYVYCISQIWTVQYCVGAVEDQVSGLHLHKYQAACGAIALDSVAIVKVTIQGLNYLIGSAFSLHWKVFSWKITREIYLLQFS